MNTYIQKKIVKILRECIDKINNDKCEINEEQAMLIMSVLSHEPLSKDTACETLHLNRSKFDELVRKNILPKGKNRKGFKELVWYKDEIVDKYQEYKVLQEN